jgi:hypothetical protein
LFSPVFAWIAPPCNCSEQRITCAKVIKRFIMHSKKTAFVVEHDFIMATYLADRVVVSCLVGLYIYIYICICGKKP